MVPRTIPTFDWTVLCTIDLVQEEMGLDLLQMNDFFKCIMLKKNNVVGLAFTSLFSLYLKSMAIMYSEVNILKRKELGDIK